ncbi:porin, partial [Bacillus sp. AFS075960]
TYTNATQNGASAHWNQGNLALDYALSKRTDVYGLVIYQKASGNNVQAQIGSSTSYFNTSGNGSSNQIAARVGIRHKF